MLKRSGGTHTGTDKTMPLAILCPACPQPGINLPEGWEQATKETRFVSSLKLILLTIHESAGYTHCSWHLMRISE